MKIKFGFILCSIAFFVLIILYPSAGIAGASSALNSWLTIVLPSLMPFCVACTLLSECGVVSLLAGILQRPTRRLFGFSGYFAYVFLSSATSGYPLGARVATELYAQGKLDEEEAAALVNCTSTSGPMFLVGAVAIGMVGKSEAIPFLVLPHYLAALLLAVVAGWKFRKRPHPPAQSIVECSRQFVLENPLKKKHIGSVLLDSVTGSIKSMLTVGGFMIVYLVLINCLSASGALGVFSRMQTPSLGISLFSGFLEMTTGCLQSSQLPLLPRITILSAIIGFGGLSIHSQTHAIAASGGLRLKGFFWYKLAQGILSFGLSALMLALFTPSVSVTTPIQSAQNPFYFTGAAFLLFALISGLLVWKWLLPRRRKSR